MSLNSDLQIDEKSPAIILIAAAKWENFEQVFEVTKDAGVRLYWATSQEEAIDILENIPVEILISDWGSGAIDGVGLCRQVKNDARWNTIHAILITEPKSVRDHVLALENGADDLLMKPVNPYMLKARLQVGMRLRDVVRQKQVLEQRQALLATIVTVGHKINNPLCAVIGHASLLREEIDEIPGSLRNEYINEHLDTIESEAERIAEVVRQLQELKELNLTNYLGETQMVALPGDDSDTDALPFRRKDGP